uniref:Nitrogen fixation protein FixH n=1 Tax=Candidatus Kentrum sp. DK TaxID=2126562 RepID=A0A450STK1_9GAMM|nr:MAG: Nitrogen fixation protein FixH [Candidatus Kentron sp. DK]
MNAPNHSPASRPAWKNPWVIGWVLIIVVIVSVNMVMIYLASSTSPGLVVEDYYERGRNYEKTVLTRQALEEKLFLQVEPPPEIRQGEPAKFHLTSTDSTGHPIPVDAVTLHAYRPSDCAYDFSTLMDKVRKGKATGVEPPLSGRYAAEVIFPLKGVWDIIIAAEREGVEHNVARRITVISE